VESGPAEGKPLWQPGDGPWALLRAQRTWSRDHRGGFGILGAAAGGLFIFVFSHVHGAWHWYLVPAAGAGLGLGVRLWLWRQVQKPFSPRRSSQLSEPIGWWHVHGDR